MHRIGGWRTQRVSARRRQAAVEGPKGVRKYAPHCCWSLTGVMTCRPSALLAECQLTSHVGRDGVFGGGGGDGLGGGGGGGLGGRGGAGLGGGGGGGGGGLGGGGGGGDGGGGEGGGGGGGEGGGGLGGGGGGGEDTAGTGSGTVIWADTCMQPTALEAYAWLRYSMMQPQI